MKTLLLVFALVLAVSAVTVTKVGYALPGTYRALTIAEAPNAATPYGIAAKGVKLDVSITNTSASAGLDVGAFAFANPNLPNQNNVGFYFGYLSATANYNPTVQIASIQAALAEVAAGFSNIYVWYDYDGQPGFQITLGTMFWNCTGTPTYDCWDASLSLDLKNDLTWSTITESPLACPPGYNQNCKVWVFSTTGSYMGSPVITFALKLASQPVFIDNVEVRPDYGKIDINISYPWATKGVNAAANAHIALLLIGGGKASSFNGVFSKIGDRNGIVFAGSGSSAYFAWDGTATIGGSQSPVYAQGFTAEQINNYQCTPGTSLVCIAWNGFLLPYLRTLVGLYAFAGWHVQFVFFSWADNKPALIVYDPTIGVGSVASVSSASFAFSLGFLLFLLWNHFKN